MKLAERILFVDDQASARETFALSLRELGFTVDVAKHGTEALALASRHPYAVIASDLRMRGTDGLSLIEELKVQYPQTAYLLVTGAANLVGRTAAMEVDGVITKPWTVDKLAAAVRKALQVHHQRRASQEQGSVAPQPKPSRLLLVEDDPAEARRLPELLAQGGPGAYHVVWARGLREALALLTKEHFEAVLVDLSLPDSRGLEPVTRVQAVTPSIPIIVLTETDEEAAVRHALQIGAQDYLVKSTLDSGILIRAVRYAIERKQSEEKLNYLLHYDQLTGLANRRLFQDRLSRKLARAKRKGSAVTALLLGLDRFKTINDTFGHEAADFVLKEVGQLLNQTIRKFETVARLGGDEFAIILDDPEHENDATVVAQRILESLTFPFIIDGEEVVVTGSIGIASYPEDGDSIEQLLACAESAMYRAKEKGRNQYEVFSKYMHHKVVNRLSLERDLRRALDRRELVLHYQPQLSIEGNKLVAVEALLRWQHKEKGLLPPMEFIPLLEETGLISEAGEWVLRSACSQVRRWQSTGYPRLRGAINLSPRQFEDKRLVDIVGRALTDFGLAPECLELEITESLLMRDTERTKATLASIKSLGVRIAIDDFGTGYSSLAYLRRFPIDSLKIDKTFVQDITTDRDDASIAAAIIGLGHKLRLDVIAEGVETEEQMAFLSREGCDAVQGYFCGRPQPAELTLATFN